MAKQRWTKAHNELCNITTDVLRSGGDGPDNLVSDIIARLPTKDAKELADLWRPDNDDGCDHMGRSPNNPFYGCEI